MKLIRCHIENFGVLSGFDFAFADGLTTICESNGFGKSTFAAFIKAMFYGFPRTGARNVVENERRRYDPWQGGKYGGYLEFETQGSSYRVTRYFGKTAAKDTFSLYDLSNRCPSAAYSERLGEELFRLDADSFSRSTYVSELSARDMEATTSIRTKLSNLVDDTNDLSNYDTAEKKLRDYRTRFRAYRGSGGRLNEIRDDCLELENQKAEAERQRPRLQELVEKIERLNEEKAAETENVLRLREKIRLASGQKARQMNRQRYSEMLGDIAGNQQCLQQMDEKYAAGYPSYEEIKTQRDNLSAIRQETARLRELKFSDAQCRLTDLSAPVENRECLAKLEEMFRGGVPGDTVLAACERTRHERDVLRKSRTAYAFSESEQKSYEALKRTFASGMPAEAEIRGKQRDRQRITELLAKKHTQTTIVQQEPAQEASATSKMPLLCGGIGAVLLLLGIACFIMKLSVPGIILLVIGFVALLAAFWLHTQSIISSQKQSTTSVIRASAISDAENQELYHLQHALEDFLLRFYDSAAEPDNKLIQLRLDVKAFTELQEKRADAERELGKINAEIERKNRTLREVFSQYFPRAAYQDDFVMVLRESRRQYQALLAGLKSQTEKREAVEQFLSRYRLSGDTPEKLIDRVDDDLHRRDTAEDALAAAQRKLNAFLQENPGMEKETADIDGDLPDLEALQASEKNLQEQIDSMDAALRALRQERDLIRRSVDQIPAWEDRMARLTLEAEEAEKKCALTEQTLALLEQAKDNLANSYVGKVERGFSHYAETLMGDGLGSVMVDKDLHLHIDEKGAAREVGSFSAGTVDCIVLCMRLALVEALFSEEKPFLILDDPFVNLDDMHTKRARKMLDRIAQDHQVVYLICNTSRE